MQVVAWKRWLIGISAMLVGACTASEAQTADSPTAAGPTTVSAEPEVAWPESYAEGEEGKWTVELTRSEIMANALEQGANARCVRDFLDPMRLDRTLTWDLYLRAGQWILYGAVDGEDPVPFDGGSYLMPHVNFELAVFTSLAPDVRDDIWLYPSIESDTLTLGFEHFTQWKEERGFETACFLEAASIVSLTNPFETRDLTW
jgi:hypothetical protein